MKQRSSPESKYLVLGQAFKFSLFAIIEYALFKLYKKNYMLCFTVSV